MANPALTVVDFETDAIEPRPSYPPKPVGVALLEPGSRKMRYLAWGHPVKNNCSKADALRVLKPLWKDGLMLFHNAKFDLDVAETHLGLRLPPWERFHDTLFLLFLLDPHAASLSLKPSAARILNMPPTEQTELRNWILANVPEARRKPSQWGAHIAKAPGDLVGKYAQGDVLRTHKLFKWGFSNMREYGMSAAYDRERRLLPVLLRAERQGVPINERLLNRELPLFQKSFHTVEEWIRKRLRAPDLNIDSNVDLAVALDKAKVTHEDGWLLTPGGDRSVSKESLRGALKDQRVLEALSYRSRLSTCLTSYMVPWSRIAVRTNGTAHPSWHQVRQGHGDTDNNMGARTGRLITSDPNLLAIAKNFEDREDGYVHPAWLAELLPLPIVRRYLTPDRGHRWGHRDYNQQELRILAHFEDGPLLQAYRDNPRLDVHNFVRDEIARIYGVSLERRAVKTINFGMLYGMGVPKLAGRLGSTVDEAKQIKAAQRGAMPGLRDMEKAIRERGKAGEAIRTWGGRLYYAEEPRIIDSEVRTFEYKLLNYLIQGSAADNTKEATLRYEEIRRDGRFLVTVYDEINISYAAGSGEMERLREAMESVEFDLPMLTDAKIGPNWGTLKPLKGRD